MLLIQDRLRNGGTERQTLLLARAMRAAGSEAQVITFRPGGSLWESATDLSPRSLQARDWGLDWYAPGLLAAVQAAAPEVLMAMGRMANCHLGRAISALKPGAIGIATFRTGKPLPYLYRRSLHAAAAVVANSTDAAQALKDAYRVPAERISVIHNGLSFGTPTPPVGQPQTRVFLNVGMFRPEKNQAGLIRLMATLPAEPPWELWLVGEGPERPACERLTQSLGLGGRVKFLGFHSDPSSMYARADVAVHASTSEALSNFLIEAQAHGLPVVAGEAQGIAECFLPGETGWTVPPGDTAAFGAAVARLRAMGDPQRVQLRSRAVAFARESFDPVRQALAYLELFGRLRCSSRGR
ncbi:MAG TPA: glycosyltransferase [Opitutaceae bacterium]